MNNLDKELIEALKEGKLSDNTNEIVSHIIKHSSIDELIDILVTDLSARLSNLITAALSILLFPNKENIVE